MAPDSRASPEWDLTSFFLLGHLFTREKTFMSLMDRFFCYKDALIFVK